MGGAFARRRRKLGAVIQKLVEFAQRIALLKRRSQFRIDRTTRLLRRFSVQFYVTPQRRCYLRVGARGFVSAKFIFESAEGHIEIGERVYIGAETTFICRHGIKIGNDVTMAWGITVYDHNSHQLDWVARAKTVKHFYDHYGRGDCFALLDWSGVDSAPITIGDRVWIGFGATILKGVTIGEGAVIAARCVVVKDVEPYTVVAGNPAHVVRRIGDREFSTMHVPDEPSSS